MDGHKPVLSHALSPNLFPPDSFWPLFERLNRSQLMGLFFKEHMFSGIPYHRPHSKNCGLEVYTVPNFRHFDVFAGFDRISNDPMTCPHQ